MDMDLNGKPRMAAPKPASRARGGCAAGRKPYRLKARVLPASTPLCRPLAECPWFTRWLYAMLLLAADGQGRMAWDAEAVRRTLLPYDSVTAASVANAARRLEAAGLLRFYRAAGEDGEDRLYAAVTEFRQHCRRLEPSKLPAPPAEPKEDEEWKDFPA